MPWFWSHQERVPALRTEPGVPRAGMEGAGPAAPGHAPALHEEEDEEEEAGGGSVY